MAHILDLGHRNISLAFLSSLYLWLSSAHFCYFSFLLAFVPKIFPSSYCPELQVLKIDEYRERIGIFLFSFSISRNIKGKSDLSWLKHIPTSDSVIAVGSWIILIAEVWVTCSHLVLIGSVTYEPDIENCVKMIFNIRHTRPWKSLYFKSTPNLTTY